MATRGGVSMAITWEAATALLRRRSASRKAPQVRIDLVGRPGQQHRQFRVGAQRLCDSGDALARPAIAAHHVNRDGQH